MKLTEKQIRYIKEFSETSGHSFIYEAEIKSGAMSFDKAWNKNIKWLEDHILVVKAIYNGWE